jgi:hypothetical protein
MFLLVMNHLQGKKPVKEPESAAVTGEDQDPVKWLHIDRSLRPDGLHFEEEYYPHKK